MNVLFGALLFGCLVELILLLAKPKWATLGRELPNKKKSIRNLAITTIAFFLLFVVTYVKSESPTIKTTVTTSNAEEASNQAEDDEDKFSITSEPNTSAAVDELILKGKNDSKNATKDNIKTAVKFINDNYNKYWNDNEVMQKTIYYGAVLQYSNENKDIKKLGEDAVQVVKYVYRKAEKIEGSSTQSNLEQIKKSLDKIPTSLK